MNNDISKCSNENCTIKIFCIRHTIIAGYRQSYCYFTQKEDGKCDHFIPNTNLLPKPNEYMEK